MNVLTFFLLCLLFLLEGTMAQEAPAPRVGDIICEADFDGPDALKGWTGPGRLGPGYKSQQSLPSNGQRVRPWAG